MQSKTIHHLNELRNARKAAVIVTNLATAEDEILDEGETREGKLGECISKAFRTGKSTSIEWDGVEYFINAHLPPPRLVVIGAVHITQALAPMAKIAGYDLEVIDPRTAFATDERFKDTTIFADWPEDVLKLRPLDAYCALAAVTHDPKIDDFPLSKALEAKCFYVGALGSRKTHAKRVERLMESGVSNESIERIHSPIGLDIGASSPQEIAVAVLGEVIHAFRNRGL